MKGNQVTDCSEREKMLAGELYDAMDPELKAGRLRARRLTRRYNQSTEEEDALRLRCCASWLVGWAISRS
jgi:maltose acetyltransferase-like protein